MSVASSLPLPEWAKTASTEEDRERTRLCFLVRLAAIYHNERSSLTALSRALGVSENHMHMILKRGTISGEIAVKLETLLGRAHFPRELFRPDLFTIPAE